MKKILIAASCVAAMALPTAAFADAAQEIGTAATHAGLAAKAANVDMVHMHMHHALNCLVGPKGDGFDAAPGNPCGSQGNGAIPDSADAGQKAKLTAVVATLKAGIANSDQAAAAKAATDAAAAITAAK
jgi:hypothetical protein